MQPTKNNAPDLSVHGAKESTHADSEAAAARDQHDKLIQTLQARAALSGFTLHLIDTGAIGPTFMVSRWNISRTLPDVASVESFLAQAGVTSA